jgi:hypothetical protein
MIAVDLWAALIRGNHERALALASVWLGYKLAELPPLPLEHEPEDC